MDCKCLMIGDLVRVWGQNADITAKPHWYVRTITADWLEDMLRREDKAKFFEEYNIIVAHPDIGDTEPIPLTDEFFEANGFKYDKACLYWYKEIEKGLWLTICVWFNKLYKIEITRGQYSYDGTHEKEVRVDTEPNVHLLQHALRLCGLEEIADNLKVE